ncbi:MAG: hypothetical protein ACJAVK_003753, partial [Akkermansiaceae bacterium]
FGLVDSPALQADLPAMGAGTGQIDTRQRILVGREAH